MRNRRIKQRLIEVKSPAKHARKPTIRIRAASFHINTAETSRQRRDPTRSIDRADDSKGRTPTISSHSGIRVDGNWSNPQVCPKSFDIERAPIRLCPRTIESQRFVRHAEISQQDETGVIADYRSGRR